MAMAIDIQNLKVSRGAFTLTVDKMHVDPGEVFALLGTTGSGKTVLLESIAGAFSLDDGWITLDGVYLDEIPVQQRQTGILYQDHALFPHMTVFDNVAYGLRMRKASKETIEPAVVEALQLLSISHLRDSYPGVISGGESQRAALARALVLKPQLLLLDEPFSALDPTTKKRLYTTVKDIQQRYGCTILFVTHDFHEAQLLADHVGIVLNGTLRHLCDATDLLNPTGQPDLDQFLGLTPSA